MLFTSSLSMNVGWARHNTNMPVDPDDGSINWKNMVVSDGQNSIHLPSHQLFSEVFDNASEHCQSAAVFLTSRDCETAPSISNSYIVLFWKILRWTKIVAFKIARSYYAFPLLLATMPLLLGLCLGYWLGQRRQQTQQSTRQTKTPSATPLRQLKHTFMAATTQSLVCVTSLLKNCVWSTTSSASTNNDTLTDRENKARQTLQSPAETLRESGIPDKELPQHIAVIMDGNRRYGREHYNGNATRGHWDGSRKLLEWTKWCQAEGIRYLTVFAFSTENWKRDPTEVAALMTIFVRYCEELGREALDRNFRVRVLSTDRDPIPDHVRVKLDQLHEETAHCTGLQVNVCLSYGSRSEIVHACSSIASACMNGSIRPETISEEVVAHHLLTKEIPDPDILLRTSGEVRISNFLLWQVAYAELFFVDKKWPELEKEDLLQILRCYASGRTRRFGK